MLNGNYWAYVDLVVGRVKTGFTASLLGIECVNIMTVVRVPGNHVHVSVVC